MGLGFRLLSARNESGDGESRKMAEIRNGVVAALAEKVWIPYAAPGGKTQVLASKIAGWNVNTDNRSGFFTSP
jgi:hypothetical protein